MDESFLRIALVPLVCQWAASDLGEGDRIDVRLEAAGAAGAAGAALRPYDDPEGYGPDHILRSPRRG